MPPLACNINRTGRVMRGVSGVLFCSAALVLARTAVEPAWARWTGVSAIALFGAFQIFEAAIGWCVVRAMGYRTPV